jgi:hypothetical protein
MNKVLAILEEHCQWLAVGAAGLFLLFMLYSYLPGLSNPVAVEIDGQSLSPGRVDAFIKNGIADDVNGRIDSQASLSAPLTSGKRFVDDIAAAINQSGRASVLPTITGFAVPYVAVAQGDSEGESGIPLDNAAGVVELPQLPEPALDFVRAGLALVQPAGAAPLPPGAAAKADLRDVPFVRYNFKVPITLLDASFRRAAIPAQFGRTAFLRVELIRQRQVGPDKWAEETVVPAIATVSYPAMPANDVSAAVAQRGYVNFALGSQPALIQPPFYGVVAGDNPLLAVPDKDALAAEAPFNPADVKPRDIPNLTPEQRKIWQEYNKQRQTERQQRPAGPPGPRGGRGGPPGDGGGGGPGFSVPTHNNVEVETTLFQTPPARPSRPGVPPPGFPPGDGGFIPPEFPGEFPGAGTGVPIAGQPLQFPPPPAGMFMPSNTPGDIYAWAYDETCKPDQTYRYRVRYLLLNPIFGTANVTQKTELTQVFALVGENPTGWSEPVMVPSTTHFFLAAQPTRDGSSVRFDVYRWQNGKRHKTSETVSFGDSVGKRVGDIDYRTTWTLVGIRLDSTFRQPYALLINPEGVLVRKEFGTDQTDEMREKLEAEVKQALDEARAPGT